MARRHTAKTGERKQRVTRRSARRAEPEPEVDESMYDEVDAFHERQNVVGLDTGRGAASDAEGSGDEAAVFDLGLRSSDSEQSDDDEEEDDEEDEDAAIERELGGPPPALAPSDSDDSDDDDEEEPVDDRLAWGRRKGEFYSADVTELDIGQDVAEAEAEEDAVKEMEAARAQLFADDDFGAVAAPAKASKRKSKGGKAKGSKEPQAEKIARDASALGRDERLQALAQQSPEVLMLLQELKENAAELRERVEPLVQRLRDGDPALATDQGLSYLEVKHELLTAYCLNVTFFLLLKAEGQPVRDHPVVRQLVEIRTLLEKLRPLDDKLRYRIDKHLAAAERGEGAEEDETDPLQFKPRLQELSDAEEDGSGAEAGEGSDDDDEPAAREGVYRAPRLTAALYDDGVSAYDRKVKDAEKRAKALSRNKILRELRDELTEAPEEISERAGVDAELEDEIEERKRFEEDRFVRLVESKKFRKRKQNAVTDAHNLSNLADIADFGDVQQLFQDGEGGEQREEDERARRRALADAVNNIEQKRRHAKRDRDTGEIDVPLPEPRVPRGALQPDPETEANFNAGFAEGGPGPGPDGEGSGRKAKKPKREVPLEEEDAFYREAAEAQAAKRALRDDHYTVPEREVLAEDEVGDGKRAASYRIIKNRGMVAHKKKAARNPRVMGRKKYANAVKRRKGQVRDVRAPEGDSYGGEGTGIKSTVTRSRKLA